jgi:hypothetical protein
MDAREANDLLRTTFTGGKVLMTPIVYELPAFLRGRALFRMSLYDTFDDNDDHSEGVFVFAGYIFHWFIAEFEGQRSITLDMEE